MNKQELETKLNELLVGKSAYDMYKLCRFLEEHLNDLGFDNTQGEFGTRLNAYTLIITYKSWVLVRFDIKRQKHDNFGWVVKQVIVDDDFVDLDTALSGIHARYKKDIDNFDKWNINYSSLGELKDLLRLIKTNFKGKNKLNIHRLARDLAQHYWLVDEALESEGE